MKTFFIISVLSVALFYSGARAQEFDSVAYIEPFLDIGLSPVQRDSLREGLYANLERIKAIHEYGLTNDIPPAMLFMPMSFN
ncbi:MAG: hypothetical protein P8X57_15225, partial [Cyclobacteriaceae bacterium]